METITRKSLLYKSRLGFYCLNHVQGCSHGCRYPCYAFKMAQHYGRVKDYPDWCRPKVVAGSLELLEKELSRMRRKPESVHLCLTTDPFMAVYPQIGQLSLALIATINRHGVPCSVVTKGVLPPELADCSVYRRDNNYQISLISLDEDFRMRWEPGSAPYRERIRALSHLHEKGSITGVHMEPYPTPNIIEQDLGQILEEISFVDGIYLSGWNYNAVAAHYAGRSDFYAEQTRIVREFRARHGIE